MKQKNWLDHFGARTMIDATPESETPAEEATPVQMLIRVDEAKR
jgi:hypothetical protein